MTAIRDAATARIPVVDLAGTEHDEERGAAAARALGKAAADTGFFYVANHGVEADLIAGAFAQARAFFALPRERKFEVLMPRGELRGYEPLEYETLNTRTGTDLKEAFRLGGDLEPGDPRLGLPSPDIAPNRWPADLPGFREAVLAYHAAVCAVGARVIRLLARSLGEPHATFEAAYRYTNPNLRLLHYPPRPADAAPHQIGAGAHTDWGGITILAQDDVGGLEVLDAAGAWLPAPPVAGTFVVNLGDLIARWTNDRYRSNPHRVLSTPEAGDRYSMALFYSPHAAAHIECLPTCVRPDVPPRYAPCTAGEHVAERRRAAYRVTA